MLPDRTTAFLTSLRVIFQTLAYLGGCGTAPRSDGASYTYPVLSYRM